MGIKRDKFDKVVSDLVRESVGYCERCGMSGTRLEAAHIFGRRHANTRYDTDNLLALCHGDHRDFTENPYIFSAWLDTTLGNGFMQILLDKKNTLKKWKKWEKAQMYEHYKAELSRVRNLRANGVDGRIAVVSYQ